MRLIVLTDVHANLLALNAALAAIDKEGYDLLVHTGDAIGIGPFPAECLDRLLCLPRIRLLMGNHDAWFAERLPSPQPEWMGNGEWAHHQWTHSQIDPALRAAVAAWPYLINETIEEVPLTFLHYPFGEDNEFLPILPQPTVVDLDAAFAPYPGRLIFYGHHHPRADTIGRARYINPGSLGCATSAVARYCHVELALGEWHVTHCAIPYDDVPLAEAYQKRAVPEAKFLMRAFHGNRFR